MTIKHTLSAIALLIPTAILVAFIIANRQMVALTLDPFWSNSESFTYHAPFSIWLFLFFGFGILLGSLMNWFAYHKCKKALKKSKAELEKLKKSITDMV
ncbi:lipopolysaccharide assembly protein LapA domain-containing protein [Bartonella machadoae]|uniref:lipopolysaccharide assembly protein LapA domain-containing protein n=1 Tax=Bartonella machadoae TaxID=2893471 RepID=UPI001F4C7EA9|nr:lipopolysaccharide assembly protein LapA domain-containing protein [Bartonella machadoae]UNE54249.1 lipopolysaccharide assembly protein LapA domain-containing protein [Bartonella machadoae]